MPAVPHSLDRFTTRKLTVRFVAIMNFVAAILGVCGAAFALTVIHVQSFDDDVLVVRRQLEESLPGYRFAAIAVAATRGLVAIGLVISGILLLKMDRFGRTLAIATAIASMILWVGFAFWVINIVTPAGSLFFHHQFNLGGYNGPPEERYAAVLNLRAHEHILRSYEVPISFCLHFAWPLVSLILLTRRNVRKAFATRGSFEIPDDPREEKPERPDRGDDPRDRISTREHRYH